MQSTFDSATPAQAMHSDMYVVTATTCDGLREHVADIENLCEDVVEANVFYEPWVLLPAIQAFGESHDLLFAFVYAADSELGSQSLCGFFPLERRYRYSGIPARVVSVWKHDQCFLSTPLVRRGFVEQTIEAFLDWMEKDRDGADVVCLPNCSGEGPLFDAIRAYLRKRGRHANVAGRKRPLLMPKADADTYLRGWSANRRQQTSRKERRLAELAPVHYEAPADIEGWMEDYIRAEASGWKGRKAVALAFQDKSREFFSRVMREGARRSRVLIVQIKAGDSFVASSAVLLSRGGGAFFYKTAYDEQFARFSPGQLLDMQLIRKIHERADIAWVDSCVAPSFLHYLRWVDEKTLANITIAMNLRGNLAFRAENAAQALRDFVTKAISVIKPARTLSGDAE